MKKFKEFLEEQRKKKKAKKKKKIQKKLPARGFFPLYGYTEFDGGEGSAEGGGDGGGGGGE
jgi:hypothetical protein